MPPVLSSPGGPFSLAVSRVCRDAAGDLVEDRKMSFLARLLGNFRRGRLSLEKPLARTV
jgi:hypothetical protein